MKFQKGRVYVILDGSTTSFKTGEIVQFVRFEIVQLKSLSVALGGLPLFTNGTIHQIVSTWGGCDIKVASEKQRTQFKRQLKEYKEVIE